MPNKWMLRQTSVDIKELSRLTGIDETVSHVLAVRGYREPSEIRDFLDVDTIPLASPFLFKDMEKAVKITHKAIKENKKIAVFGDYDADGIISTVILCKTLELLKAQFVYYIPERETEGYGLNKDAILTLKEKGVDLIITCDNGISAFQEIEFASSCGIDTIVLDHHEVQKMNVGINSEVDLLPPALAIVDAKQTTCQYPFKDYCAAAVCYRFSEAIYSYLHLNWRSLEHDLLPLVTIATICDLVDLLGENRHIVKRGLPLVANSNNLGLDYLLKYTSIDKKRIIPYHIGFILGPCINACGRLEMAAIAVELFMTGDVNRANQLAAYLVELNNSRKEITGQGYENAIINIEKDHLDQEPFLFLYCPSIQESVAGIIAGKLKDRYYKPVYIVAGDKDLVRGSCRSIDGYNIFQALSKCQDLLYSFGGHPMAAGFTVPKENIDELTRRLKAGYELDPDKSIKIYRIDKQIPICEINFNLARQLDKLQPFGKGNPVPTLADKSVKVSRINFIGKDAQILKFYCQGKHSKFNNNCIEAVSFYGKDKFEELITKDYGQKAWEDILDGQMPDLYLDLLFSLSINEYDGREYLQLHIIDFRLSK